MAYITRELERKFLKLNDFFKVILVTGARQVGKTTMLKHLAGSDRTYVTMDNTMARELAQSDPVLFFQTYKPPVLIDEVQKAPELFEQIKIICDESGEKGLIWLTGSQQYNMMKRVRETLAGRIGILELYGLSAREKAGLVFDTDLDFSLATLQARQRKLPKNDVIQVFNHIWEGGMPQVQGVDDELRLEYFNSYVDTYLMRDATEAGGITDTVRFRKFLVGCASLVSEQVNYSTLAESADIAPSTAKEWLKILVGLNIIYLLAPYSNNENNWVIVLHGYRSNPESVISVGRHFSDKGYNVLIPYMRATGESEGEYIGMGWLDKDDLKCWIDLIIKQNNNANIVLHGSSMGAATVLMASGDEIPNNVKAIIEDSGYTSVWDIFASEAKARFNLPAFPVLNMC